VRGPIEEAVSEGESASGARGPWDRWIASADENPQGFGVQRNLCATEGRSEVGNSETPEKEPVRRGGWR